MDKYRGLVIFILWIVVIDFYFKALSNIVGFFTVVITGEPYKYFSFTFWNTFGIPLIILFVMYLYWIRDTPTLFPAIKLAMLMMISSQCALFIVHQGLVPGGSVVQKAVFLLLGLIGFLLARWGISHHFYSKYETAKIPS